MTSYKILAPKERYRYISYQESQNHPDFQIPWVKELLADRNVVLISEVPEDWAWYEDHITSNAMFNHTLAYADGIRARIQFRRPSGEQDSFSGVEVCWLLSIGSGLEGKIGRAHGGLSSIILDNLMGTTAQRETPVGDGSGNPPATATLTVDYKNPVSTPSIIFARAWKLKESVGRKTWLRGVLQDADGKTLATAKALFVNPRAQGKL